jgi:hypothetical protein
MLKNIILLLLIFSVILILCSVSRTNETYRPFVTLYGTNPIRQRRSGWRNYFGGYGSCPYGSCPGCPYGACSYDQTPTDSPQPPQWSQGPYGNQAPQWSQGPYGNQGPYGQPRQLGVTPYGEGMYTSTYGDVCSRYGSSTIDADPSTYYMGSRWCPVGVVSNPTASDKLSSTQALEGRFMGNSWSFRVRDGLTGMHIYLNTVGQGSYGAYRDGDVIQIPGKEGDWKVQVQTQYQPYLLYLPF